MEGSFANFTTDGLFSRQGSSATIRVSDISLPPYDTALDNPPKRPSVRLVSKEPEFGLGLFVFHVRHLPEGCGTWPAWRFFQDFDDDPDKEKTQIREIDVIELSNKVQTNQATLHTSTGCTQETHTKGGRWNQQMFSGSWVDVCKCGARYNEGVSSQCPKDGPTEPSYQCGIYQSFGAQGSFAEAFNKGGGGFYAMERTAEHVKMWWWPNGAEPSVLHQATMPASLDQLDWGLPFAYFSLGARCPSQTVWCSAPCLLG